MWIKKYYSVDKLSTNMHARFLDFLKQNNISPMLITILQKSSIQKKADKRYILQCPNYGALIYLKSKQELIKEYLSLFTKKSVVIVEFSIKQKKKTDPHNQLTFLQNTKKLQNKTVINQRNKGVVPYYTFENFAVSPSNQMVYAASLTVCEKLGKLYNPFFIYGGVGVGKTHICHAILNRITENNPSTEALFCSSEEFTNDLIDLIQKKNTPALRRKYRSLKLLIVDDVQFIAGKNYVQEEFYHTFNSIIKNGGQIILTSDKPPSSIKKLEDRLRSRFLGGLLIDIQKPDFELRTAIVLIKAKERNILIDMDAAKKIAETTIDTRALEGNLLKLYMQTQNTTGFVGIEDVVGSINKERDNIKNDRSPTDVIRVVCGYYNIRPSQIKSPSRKEEVARARQIIMYVLRTTFKLKLEEISFILKKKDHTTIMYGVQKITSMRLKDDIFRKEVDTIISSLN